MNRATRLAAELLDNEGEALTRKAVELALAGDIGALRLCLERIYPARRARVQIDLPKVETAADLPKAMSAVLAADSVSTKRPASVDGFCMTCPFFGRDPLRAPDPAS